MNILLDKRRSQMSQPVDEPTAREEITKRLARIAGHAQSLKRMWEEGRQIDDMLTQVAAVRAALDQAGRAMLELHIDETVAKAVKLGETADAIRELKEALDRFI
jgi:CsoR family transcriptional regulator, copper-sensing transcriptional repressor